MSAPAAAVGTFVNVRDGLPQRFYDSFSGDRVADPAQAYGDVRAAHAWVSAQLAAAVDPTRRWNLEAERRRLAGIAWYLKRRWSL